LSVFACVALIRLLERWFADLNLALAGGAYFAALPGVWMWSATALTSPTCTFLAIIALAWLLDGRVSRMFAGRAALALTAGTRLPFIPILVAVGLCSLPTWRSKPRLWRLGGIAAVV